MVSDRDCINLSDIAYLDISKYKGVLLGKIFLEKKGEGHYRIRDEFRNSDNPQVKKFVEQLRAFPNYYHPTLMNYTLIDTYSSSFTGYYGIACINNEGEIVLANRGSSGLLDYLNDLFMAACKIPPQASSAFGFYLDVVKAAGIHKSHNITLTGHSLGGSLATFQMLRFYGDGYLKRVKTFEEFGVIWCVVDTSKLGIAGFVNIGSVGLSKNYQRYYHSWDKIKTAYKNSFDFVANTSMHIGKVVNLTRPNHLGIKLAIDPYHTLNTFKIYALDADGNIIPGEINEKDLEELKKLDPGADDGFNELNQTTTAHNKQVILEKNQIDQKNKALIKELLDNSNPNMALFRANSLG